MWGEGRKVDIVLIGTGKVNATTWQRKLTGIAPASRGFLAAVWLSCLDMSLLGKHCSAIIL